MFDVSEALRSAASFGSLLYALGRWMLPMALTSRALTVSHVRSVFVVHLL